MAEQIKRLSFLFFEKERIALAEAQMWGEFGRTLSDGKLDSVKLDKLIRRLVLVQRMQGGGKTK